MRVKITYRVPNESGQLGEELEDVLQWPDVENEQEVQHHAAIHLDSKWGAGHYILLKTEVLS